MRAGSASAWSSGCSVRAAPKSRIVTRSKASFEVRLVRYRRPPSAHASARAALAAPASQHDVFGLDIPVNDAAGMNSGQGLHDLAQDPDGTKERQGAFFLQHKVEPLAMARHDQVHGSVSGFAEIGHANDIGVIDQTGGLRFAEKARLGSRLAEQVAMEDLHRRGLADVDMGGPIDNAPCRRGR